VANDSIQSGVHLGTAVGDLKKTQYKFCNDKTSCNLLSPIQALE